VGEVGKVVSKEILLPWNPERDEDDLALVAQLEDLAHSR